MASNPSSPTNFSDLTTCPICFDTFEDPRALPCLHTFCRKCLQQLCSSPGQKQSIRCPTCRQEIAVPSVGGVDKFIKDFRIQSLIDIQAGWIVNDDESPGRLPPTRTPTSPNGQFPGEPFEQSTRANSTSSADMAPAVSSPPVGLQLQRTFSPPMTHQTGFEEIQWNQPGHAGNHTPGARGHAEMAPAGSANAGLVTGLLGDGREITAVTSVGPLLLLVRHPTRGTIELYDSKTLAFIRALLINQLAESVFGLASCFRFGSYVIYASDVKKVIHRVEVDATGLQTSMQQTWRLKERPYGLWINSQYNLLVTCQGNWKSKLIEYNEHGAIRRKIRLANEVQYAHHAVELNGGHYVVSQGGSSSRHQVCLVDGGGKVIRSFGGTPGKKVGQLNNPWQMAFDRHGNVYVADSSNNRVVVLSSELKLLHCIVDPTSLNGLGKPYALCFNSYSDSFYVGECGGDKRLLAFKMSLLSAGICFPAATNSYPTPPFSPQPHSQEMFGGGAVSFPSFSPRPTARDPPISRLSLPTYSSITSLTP